MSPDASEFAPSVPSPESLATALSAIPVVVALLDEERRVVFGREKLLDLVGVNEPARADRTRPGDLVGCVNALAAAGGCGTSEACSLCGAFCAITESRRNDATVSRECRIQYETLGKAGALDITVTASPYTSDETTYTLLTVRDSSAEKRRRALERVFFHDILNTAGGLSGLARLLRDTEDPQQFKALLSMLETSARSLLDEIVAQRQLVSAENGDLPVHVGGHEASAVLQSVADTLGYHEVARGRHIIVTPVLPGFTIHTDKVLLQRVLVNLTKNALEAVAPGEAVTLSAEAGQAGCDFLVHNPGVIPRDVQLQLFQRSFSTRGEGRGLGTYSVRLLVHNYLAGSVSFRSQDDGGTTFVVRLPLRPPAWETP